MVKLRITEATLLMFYHVLFPLFGCQKTTDTIECIREGSPRGNPSRNRRQLRLQPIETTNACRDRRLTLIVSES